MRSNYFNDGLTVVRAKDNAPIAECYSLIEAKRIVDALNNALNNAHNEGANHGQPN